MFVLYGVFVVSVLVVIVFVVTGVLALCCVCGASVVCGVLVPFVVSLWCLGCLSLSHVPVVCGLCHGVFVVWCVGLSLILCPQSMRQVV